MSNILYKKVGETVRKCEMVGPGDRVVVGVSGGPDSIFLLYALYHLKDELGIDIFVANLDHGVRGRASAADSRFVIKRVKELKLKFVHKKLKLKKGELNGKLSVEEVLRKRRYDFFKKAAKRFHANIIATGHTMDDQAETVLMRVIKGSTIKGLVGIPAVGKNGRLNVIRPLIEIEKNQILDFLNERKIPYCSDYTNLQERYFRNSVRRKILPYIARYNPRIKRTLCLMAESLREDREFIEEEKRKNKQIKKNRRYVSIKLKDLVVQPKTLQREIVRDALIETGGSGSVKKLTYRHWKDMDDFLRYKRKGQSMDLPGSITVKRDATNIIFKKRSYCI